MNPARIIRRTLFRLSPRATRLDRFCAPGGEPGVRRHLEGVVESFAAGFNAAVEGNRPGAMGPRLEAMAAERRGFAAEGAAMYFALRDLLPGGGARRWAELAAGPGRPFVHLLHAGAGMAAARVPRSLGRVRRRLDPLLGWLAVDGYGFHEGLFRGAWRPERGGSRRRLAGYARRAFDQGLGRSLWFVMSADPRRVASVIAGFDEARRGDLWSGVGLGATYAGGVPGAVAGELRRRAGRHADDLSQGAAFAAKARLLGGCVPPDSRAACRELTGLPAETAARITDDALDDVAPVGDEPSYESWRRRVRHSITESWRKIV